MDAVPRLSPPQQRCVASSHPKQDRHFQSLLQGQSEDLFIFVYLFTLGNISRKTGKNWVS